MGLDLKRRTVLALAGGLVLGGLGASSTTAQVDGSTDETFTILEGTDHETTGYVRTADADGPTALVVGGIHGNEDAGYEAAANVTDLPIERGRLVVVPRANVVAIENETRTGEDGVDLNRQFPVGSEPTTELARALWDVVTRFEPDTVIDLHESTSLYEGDVTEGVGQVIFHSRDESARADAQQATEYVNENYVSDSTYDFTSSVFSDDDGDLEGLFVHKAARDTDAVAFLAETVSSDPTLATRIEWHTQIVRSLSEDELFDEAEESANEPPVAVIETDPADAPEMDLSKGDTVVLDGSESSDPDGEIASYEWDLGDTGEFDMNGQTVEVELSLCGDLPVSLRVTDDQGATATTEIVLSTV